MIRFFVLHRRTAIAAAALLLAFGLFIAVHPRGLSVYVATIWSNQGATLALVAMAQCFAVLVRGIDLSVGPMMALCNALASHLLSGSPLAIAAGLVAVVATGAFCGLINGWVIVKGRIQAIIATLATGSVYTGVALLLRPTPGGQIDPDLSDALTYDVLGVPTSMLIILALLVCVWIPLRRSPLGLRLYAVGSAENAAFLSGVDVDRTKLLAHMMSGIFAALAGLYIGMVTNSGDAGLGPAYTLNSVAAVVLGGVSLNGGVGGLLGAVVGAFLIRTISSLMFFSGLAPLAQPFVEGLVLALAIGLSAFSVLRVRNRLEVYTR